MEWKYMAGIAITLAIAVAAFTAQDIPWMVKSVIGAALAGILYHFFKNVEKK